jgi:hypothetical protein
MAHDHHHHHGESATNYFMEQLLTILVCGLFGFVAIRLYMIDGLKNLLNEMFHLPVLIGGIGVLVLVAIRAVTVWREAGQMHAHAHHDHDHDYGHNHGHNHEHHHHHHHEHGEGCEHDHGPGCDHDHKHQDRDHGHEHHHPHTHDLHTHAGDDHGHSHDLSWVLVRMMILLFPVALFFLGVPRAGLSKEMLERLAASDEQQAIGDSADTSPVAAKSGTAITRFDDLNAAAYDPVKREAMEGMPADLQGRFLSLGSKEFSLYRARMTCCAGDTVILKARIRTNQALSGFRNQMWVRVRGQITFVKVQGKDGREEYIPVVRADVANITEMKDVDANSDYER